LSTNVVVVDSRIHILLIVIKEMFRSIVAGIAEIQSACEGELLIDDDELFMMGP
jgi:hypothetical protein